MTEVTVVGAGLAGCEAAWQLAQRDVAVRLVEMRPVRMTPAHKTGDFAELVCSNSLRSDALTNAVGVLKEEMRRLGSLIMQVADEHRLPAGSALAVDRERFSRAVTERISAHPRITIVRQEVQKIPEGPCIIASGPLTSDSLSCSIREFLQQESFYFYDAAAPIIEKDSIDFSKTFTADRYGKGEGDYVNCPMTREEYEAFVDALLHAERANDHGIDRRELFEGCMPVEAMAARGADTLRFGMLKPVGLYDAEGKRPYAVLQLRKENCAGTAYNLVGFQTNLKFPEQKRVFSMIPALRGAEFLRYGVMHRNTYLNAPEVLSPDYSLRADPLVFFAGQITGVEGYVESADSGLAAAIALALKLRGAQPVEWDAETVTGALALHVSQPTDNFQPMNANYGILRPLAEHIRDKALKKRRLAERALERIDRIAGYLRGQL